MQLSLGRYFREEEKSNTGKKYLYDLFYLNEDPLLQFFKRLTCVYPVQVYSPKTYSTLTFV